MALIPTVTKVSVIKHPARGGDGKFTVSLNLTINDDILAQDVINTDLAQFYNSTSDTISNVQERFRVGMQKLIDDYKLGIALSENAQLATAITNLEGSLVV